MSEGGILLFPTAMKIVRAAICHRPPREQILFRRVARVYPTPKREYPLNNQGCCNKKEAEGPSTPAVADEAATPMSIATVAHNTQDIPKPTEAPAEQVIEVPSLPTWFRDPVG